MVTSYHALLLGHDLQYYISTLPDTASDHLCKKLDYDNEGVDKDLHAIAEHMLEWEWLSPILGLTTANIHDIKSKNHMHPSLQR